MSAATLDARYYQMTEPEARQEPGMERFSFWLRQHMESRSLSQRQVASYAEVAPTTVGLWLKGYAKPKLSSLKKLADGLGKGVTYKFLVGLIDADLEGGDDSAPHYAARYKELDTQIAAAYAHLETLIRRRRQADDA